MGKTWPVSGRTFTIQDSHEKDDVVDLLLGVRVWGLGAMHGVYEICNGRVGIVNKYVGRWIDRGTGMSALWG